MQQPQKNNNQQQVPPKQAGAKQMIAEETFTTSVIGGVGIGKTFNNVLAAKIYAKDNPQTGKKGRKVLILNFQNEDGYAKFKTLPPTHDAIIKFVNQKTIEIRQITSIDSDGRPMPMPRKVEVMKMVLNNFRNGLVIFDDVDGYAAYGASSDKDLVGLLMGLRHRGCHTLFAHQAWRKMGVAEVENLRFIRLHKANDNPLSLPADKLHTLDKHMCMIAHYAVEAQFELANRLYEEGKLKHEQWIAAKSYHIYIDRAKRRLFPIHEKNFELAVRRYCSRDKKVLVEEISEMIFEDAINPSQKNKPETRAKAIKRLIDKFKKMYLKK